MSSQSIPLLCATFQVSASRAVLASSFSTCYLFGLLIEYCQRLGNTQWYAGRSWWQYGWQTSQSVQQPLETWALDLTIRADNNNKEKQKENVQIRRSCIYTQIHIHTIYSCSCTYKLSLGDLRSWQLWRTSHISFGAFIEMLPLWILCNGQQFGFLCYLTI